MEKPGFSLCIVKKWVFAEKLSFSGEKPSFSKNFEKLSFSTKKT